MLFARVCEVVRLAASLHASASVFDTAALGRVHVFSRVRRSVFQIVALQL